MEQRTTALTQSLESRAAPTPRFHDLAGGYRVATQRGPLLAWFEGVTAERFTVTGLSPHAIWLDSHSYRHMHAYSAPLEGRLWLDGQGQRLGPFSVELCSAVAPSWLPHGGRSVIAGLAVPRGPLNELRSLALFVRALERAGAITLPERDFDAPERVTDPAEVRELLEFLARAQLVGSVQTESGFATARMVDTGTLPGLRWESDSDDWLLPSTVNFSHLNTVYQVPVAGRSGPSSTVSAGWIGKLCRRRVRRVAAPPELRISFSHPLSPDVLTDASVLEVSSRGLYFRTEALDHLLYPGLLLPQLTLSDAAGSRGNYRASIRSVRFEPGDQHALVGLSLEPASATDMTLLRALLDPLLYPTTLGRAEDVWNVFETSGYLNLSGKGPADFERLRAPFSYVAKAIERAPDVGTLAHWPATGKVQATLSHLKLYQSSWLLCQVSKLKGEGADASGRVGLRDMYLRIYESAHDDPDTRFLLVYVQDEAPRWSRELHVELPRRYARKGEACLVPFRALEVDVQPRDGAALSRGLRIEVAEGAAAAGVARDLTSLRPTQYLEALDLCEQRIDLSAARARWRAAGLERERQVLVAYDNDTRVAAAVVETTEEGAHLYGLLDCLRMYPLRPEGERAFAALLNAAHGWFLARGRRQFTYLEEYPDTLPLAELGFRDLGGATFSILPVERTPELLQRAADLASRRRPAVTRVVEARGLGREPSRA